MTETHLNRLAAFTDLPLTDLQARYAELVGEPTDSEDREHLLRRIAEVFGTQEQHTAEAPTPADATPSGAPEQAPELAAVASTEASEALAEEVEIEALRARYLAVVGRATGSRDQRYLRWKIRLATQGKVPVGPVGRRQPGEAPVEHKVLPLRMPAETVEALDEVWKRRGLKSRMDLFRNALDQYLTALGEARAAERVRGA
jgi:hypothetical protein